MIERDADLTAPVRACPEQGNPRELAASGSRYAELLAAEEKVRNGTWASTDWRRVHVARGQVTASGSGS